MWHQVRENPPSNFGQYANYETAYGFYNAAGWSADRTLSHLGAIDFTQPVTVTQLPAGTSAVQYVVSGRPVGNYFAPVGTPATQLGVNPAGRIPMLFSADGSITVLQSTAAPVVDTWTVSGQPYPATGAGTQWFTPNPALFKKVP